MIGTPAVDGQTAIRCQCMVRTATTDRQRLEALIKRGIRSGLCGADVSSLAELVDSADDALLQRILYVQSQPRFTLTVTRSQRNRTLS